jgi:hypothetical protein
MAECPICANPRRREAIEQSFGATPDWKRLAWRWHLAENLLRVHAAEHMPQLGAIPAFPAIDLRDEPPLRSRAAAMVVPESPLSQFKRLLPSLRECVRLAKDDIQMLEMMQFELNAIFGHELMES